MNDILRHGLTAASRKLMVNHGYFMSNFYGLRIPTNKRTTWVGDASNAWSIIDALTVNGFNPNFMAHRVFFF